VQPDYMHLTECIPERFKCLPLPFTLMDMMPSLAYAMKQVSQGDPRTLLWRACGHMTANLVVPALDDVLKEAKQSKINVVLSTTLTWSIAHTIAEHMEIPLVILTLQADIRTKYAPHMNEDPEKAAVAALSSEFLPDESNYVMYDKLDTCGISEYIGALNQKRAALNLKELSVSDAQKVQDGGVPTMVGVSPNIVPQLPDYSDNVHIVGSLAPNYLPPGYSPPHELVQFLDAGAPPIVVSYGSLGKNCDPKILTRTVLTALRESSGHRNEAYRIILLPGNAGIDMNELDAEEDEELRNWATSVGVLTLRSHVQYAWLLPKARLLLCHGGAGCTAAALNAGIPLVISPVFVDQLFYAAWVRKSGHGAATSAENGLVKLDATELAAAVTHAFGDDIRQNVKAFANKESQLQPLAHAVRILDDLVSRK